MFDVGLAKADFAAYLETLATTHRMRVDFRLHDRDEKPIAQLTSEVNQVLGGQVDVEAGSDRVSRTLSLNLLDPEHKLRFDADSPTRGALYADRFISARHEVYVPDLEGWVSCPVFMGPLTSFKRQGAEIELAAEGKEALMLAPYLATNQLTVHKRTRLDDGIERVARQAGERRFALPKLRHRLVNSRPVERDDELWRVLAGGDTNASGQQIPGLIERGPGNYGLYYNPAGELAARRKGGKPVFTFESEHVETGSLATSYDDDTFRNTVIVRGGRRKGEHNAFAKVSLPDGHPLSPKSLARNGESRYITEVIDADGLQTDRACEERGKEVLDRLSQMGVEVEFTSAVIPFLEEDDRCRFDGDGYRIDFTLRSFTIPLNGEAMSVGWHKQVHPRKRKHSR